MSQDNQTKPIIEAQVYPTKIADIFPTVDKFGEKLTRFYLIKKGDINPYKGAILELIDGPDAGKQFLADVGKPQRFLEPFTVTLLSEIKSE